MSTTEPITGLRFPEGVVVRDFSRAPFGRNHVYLCRGRLADRPAEFVVKIARDSGDGLLREVEMLGLLGHSGIPVPQVHCVGRTGPIFAVMARVSGDLLRHILVPPFDGPPGHAGETLAYLEEYGRTLARIHALPLLTKEHVPDHEAVVAEVRERARFRKIHVWLLDNEPSQREFVFSHGDYNPMNVLVSGGGISGVVDWEAAGIDLREQDLARALTANVRPLDCAERAAVLKGYTRGGIYDPQGLRFAEVRNTFVGACILRKKGMSRYAEYLQQAERLIAADGVGA